MIKGSISYKGQGHTFKVKFDIFDIIGHYLFMFKQTSIFFPVADFVIPVVMGVVILAIVALLLFYRDRLKDCFCKKVS